jgi:hypothetical protein
MSAVDTRVVPFPVSNEQFLQAVFKDRWGEALLAYFLGDPEKSADWRVYPAADVLRVMTPSMNNYWDVSLPVPGGSRQGQHFGALYAIVLDDYGVKVVADRARTILGSPSYIIETSRQNFHAGWFIEPLTDHAWVTGMLRALYEALGRTGDNLVKPTTLVRLPVGTNGKAKNGAAGFPVKLVYWKPDTRIDRLDWPAIEKRLGTITPTLPRVSLLTGMPDPAEIEDDLILKVFRGRGMVLDHGRTMPFGWGFEVICPWAGEHTDPRSAASYIPVKERFKCHHGHCENRSMADVRAWADASIRDDSGGLESLARLEFDDIERIGPGTAAPCPRIVAAGAIDLWDQKTPPGWQDGVFPAVLEDTLADLAMRDGLDLGALGATMITAASGAADKRTLLRPYAGSLWPVRPVLWTMLVAETGLRKTALLKYPLERLRRLNLERMRHHSHAMTAWRGLPAASRQAPGPTVIALLAEDVTVEKLQSWMADNPRGLLYLRDELVGLFDFGRYSSGPGTAERGFFLETYEGGPTTIGRMTRTTTIDNCALAVLGGIQQQKLADFKGLAEDGLLSRLGVVLQQAVPGGGKPVSGKPDASAIDSTIDRLLAAGAFDEYRTNGAGETLIRETERFGEAMLLRPDLGLGFRGFLRKLHGVHARAALVLHLMDGGQDPVIPEDTINRAGRYTRFLYRHAEVFYAGLPGSADHTAQAIGSFILRHPALNRMTAGQLRRDIAACRQMHSLKEIQDAVFLLVIGGWLSPETSYPSNYAWRVRPELRDQFAARITLETERVDAIKAAMNQWGRHR